MERAFTQWLTQRFAGRLRNNEPMARHTSLGVGGPAEVYLAIADEQELRELVRNCTENKIPYMILAGGTNLLVTDRGIRGVVIDIKHGLKEITRQGERNGEVFIVAQAGAGLQMLCRYAIDKGLAGMNFALGIPGTVGGAVVMNAGTEKGNMAEVVTAVTVLQPNGETVSREKEALDFIYRGSSLTPGRSSIFGGDLITSVLFSLCPDNPETLRTEANAILKKRMQAQPKGVQSAGCFFKNPSGREPAGKLIDRAGLKGKAVGGAAVSKVHANFIVTRPGATAADVLNLMTQVQQTVADDYGVCLEPEVVIVGE